MIITRKLGKIFRGKATPAHLMMASVIGTTTGFMPGFLQAPGLLAVLFLAAVLLNANLALLGICLLLAGALSILLLPVTFAVGRFLLEGPLEGFFAGLINAPVLALFGFEYYATTGGLAVGLLLGAGFGFGVVRAVRSFRRKMVELDRNSDRWRSFHERRLVKLFVFIFVGGGRGKLSYEDLLSKKGGLFRPLGLVGAVLLVVVGFFVTLFAGDSIVSYAVQSNLERANGATVDLDRAELSLREGRLTLTGLAVADPENLRTDLFRAALIEADISQADLLRKRVHIERLRVVEAASGEARERAGIPYRPLPKRPPAQQDDKDGKSLEDYLADAQVWRQRIEQVADWFDRLSGPGQTAGGASPAESEDGAARERRLQEQGYRHAVASHLVRGAPSLLVSRASVEKMRVVQMPDETLEVSAENLSTHPNLVEAPPRITVRSSAERFLFNAELAEFAKNASVNSLQLVYLGVPVDSVAGGLKFSGQRPVQGGTLDFRSQGSWTASTLDLPVEATLRNTRLSLAGSGETPVEELMLPIGVAGSLRNPRIHFSDADFADALAAAGKAELSRRVRGEADKLREQAEEKVGEELRERTRGLLDGRFPGR